MRFFYKPTSFIFFCGLILFCYGLLTENSFSILYRLVVASICFSLIILAGAAYISRSLWWPYLLGRLNQHTDHIDTLSERHAGWWILLASGLCLYVELLIIRWHASCFSLFAHFKNISLLSCFLGLGIGYTLGRRRPLTTPLLLPALSIQIIVLQLLRTSKIQYLLMNPIKEQFAHGLIHISTPSQNYVVYGFLIIVFLFNMLTFIPLGQLASRLMLKRPALVAYGWNLMGSLFGIGLFSILAYAWFPPTIWLLLGSIGILIFLSREFITLAISAISVASALLLLSVPPPKGVSHLYSPYQIVTVFSEKGHPITLRVNHIYHQRILDLSHEAQLKNVSVRKTAEYYGLPYLLKPHPDRVLIVGSGTGNDVAAALRRGAKQVDAVEIDPAILHFGKSLHPEKPYENKRVNAIVNDARNFIRRTKEKYDMIVYGLLDSHTMPTGMANTRLDSFVYTVEAFREARAKLKHDGIICMSFSIFSRQHGRKLFLMLQEAFDGMKPRVYSSNYDYAFTYVIGPGMVHVPGNVIVPFREATDWFDDKNIVTDLSTDDWPFFYMPLRIYPTSYMLMVGILIVVSLLCVKEIVPKSGEKLSASCFFLGAGFMLVETKGITELGLNFGNTWMVISVVITSILLMAFLANLTVAKLGAPHPLITYGLLIGSLLAGFSLVQINLTALPFALGKICMAFLLTLPLFFSGIAFSTELSRYTQVPSALSSNLMGAMFGGFLEYNSMYFGFRSLYLFAIGIYCLAFFSTYRTTKTV